MTAEEVHKSYFHQSPDEILFEASGWDVVSIVLDRTDITLNVIVFKFLRNEKYSWSFSFNLARVLNRNYQFPFFFLITNNLSP